MCYKSEMTCSKANIPSIKTEKATNKCLGKHFEIISHTFLYKFYISAQCDIFRITNITDCVILFTG
jgi:hypothetical protein